MRQQARPLRRAAVGASFLACVACGVACGGGSPTPNEHVRLDLPDAGTHERTPSLPAHALGLPRNPVLLVSIDPTLGLTALPEIRSRLERRLGLPDNSLDPNAVGLDARRPIALVFGGLTDGQRKLVAEVRPLSATNVASAATTPAAEHVAELGSLPPMRVLLPATDPAKVREYLGALFDKESWRAHGALFLRGHSVIEISADATNVAVDVGDGHTVRETLAAMHAAFADGAEPPPPLDGGALRVEWAPADLAAVGFLSGIVTTSVAVSGGAIDPSQRDRIAAQGFFEAGRLFALAGTAQGSFFEHVEVTVRLAPFDVTVRARIGKAWSAPPPEAWKPSASIALAGAAAEIEGTPAGAALWRTSAPDPQKLLEMVRDGGMAGWLVAMPQLLGAAPLLAPAMFHADLPDDAVVARFERIETAWMPSGSAIFAGILPTGTTRAAAECAFAPAPKCAGKAKLKVGAVVHLPAPGTRFAKLLEVDHRWVVLAADEEAPLKTAKPTPSRAEGPLHVELALKQLAQQIQFTAALPDHTAGDLALDGDALVFRLAAQ